MSDMASFLILCETYNPDGTPHKTNTRRELEKATHEDNEDMLFSVEQEYTLIDNDTNEVVGWETNTQQGENYCGVGSKNVKHRLLSEQHALLCMQAGINVVGTNAEVLISQWEYQLGPKDALTTADDLWISRYILHRLTEGNNFHVSLEPKPIEGEWNGAGAHINFSTEYMREVSDEEYITNVCEALSDCHLEHINVYGEGNEKRLTGKCETQHINKFTYGVSDRGASVRIPQTTAGECSGYLEDRRPAANVDPYEAFPVILNTVSSVKMPQSV
jgi:glutamine synthetase